MKTLTVMILGLDWAGPNPAWRRQPFADGGRLQFDRTRPADWDNLFHELGDLARVDSVAFGLRGIVDVDAMAALPVARAAWTRARVRPTVTAWCDTVGLGDIVNVPGRSDVPFDCANPQHVAWTWDRYLKPFFDVFGTARLTRSASGRLLLPWWGLASKTGHGIRNQAFAQGVLDHIDRRVAALGLGGVDHVVDRTWLELCPSLRVYGVHDWFNPWATPPRAFSIRTHLGVTVGVTVPSFYDHINPEGNAATLAHALATMAAHDPPVDVVLLEGGTDFSEAAEFMRDASGSTAKLDAVRHFVDAQSPHPDEDEDMKIAATFSLRRSQRTPHPTRAGYWQSPYPGTTTGEVLSVNPPDGHIEPRPAGTDGGYEAWKDDGTRAVFDDVDGYTFAFPLVD